MVSFRHGRHLSVKSAAAHHFNATPGTITKIGPCVNCYYFIINLWFLQDFFFFYSKNRGGASAAPIFK